MLCAALLAVALLSAISCQVISINESDELDQYLCKSKHSLENDTTILLYSSITHVIDGVSFCVVNGTVSLTITSNSTAPATIQCAANGSNPTIQPNGGFAFVNSHNLTLQRLIFVGCGAYLTTLDKDILEIINSSHSPVYFTQYQSAVLLFLHVKALFVSEVDITSYYGFGILAINQMNAVLHDIKMNLSKSLCTYNSLGSGILLLFVDDNNDAVPVHPSNVSIKKANMTSNNEYASYIIDWQHLKAPIPVMNVAGLTILYTQKLFIAHVYVNLSEFTRNVGGAFSAFYFHTSTESQVVVDKCLFERNHVSMSFHGSGISMIILHSKKSKFNNDASSKPLTISNCRFLHKKRHSFGVTSNSLSSAILIKVYNPPATALVVLTFSNVTFGHNAAATTGSSLYIKAYSMKMIKAVCVVLENITAEDNSQIGMSPLISKAGIFVLVNLKSIHISRSRFYDNCGSVFEVVNSNIYLKGNVLFLNNTGERGSAFKIYGNGLIHLENSLNMTFINNTVLTKGGAIYLYGRAQSIERQCTFQSIVSPNTISQLNISMSFINNTAKESGSSIFSTNIYNCYINNHYFNTSQANKYFNKLSNGSLNDGLSTLPYKRCICLNGACAQEAYPIKVYPGQTLHVPLAAVDAIGKSTYTDVSFTLAYNVYKHGHIILYNLPSWYISPNDVNQVLSESKCTIVNITLLSRGNDFNPYNSFLVVSSVFDSSILKMRLQLLDCPLGFSLNNITGKCECSQVVNCLGSIGKYQPSCEIRSKESLHNNNPIVVITRPPDSISWLGMVKNEGNATASFGVALTCYHYCSTNPSHTAFVINGTNVLTVNPDHINNEVLDDLDLRHLCMDNRVGPLCSKCAIVDGVQYSVVFGSTECMYCSNWWLLTLILYALAGPLLIYVLFSLKLTLSTGTINGIVFYAQAYAIIDGVRYDRPNFEYIYFRITDIFVNFLNLNLGFPLCFYNGMTELWKAGLSLLFPVYLLAIVLALIVLSRYSVRLSNKISHSSVQVLVTVVHLSFSTLLITVMNVFTPIDIYLNTTDIPLKVWYNDGTTKYGKGGHFILMIITGLIVGTILLTYMTILIAGRPLQKINHKVREYIRPIYEAIHAPYCHNKEFFFTARLFLITFLYTLYIIYRGNDRYQGLTIAAFTLTAYSILETLCRPCKKMYLNGLNAFLLASVLSIVGTIWYFYKNNNMHSLVMLLLINTSFVMISFVVIVALHALWVTKGLRELEEKAFKLYSKFFIRSLSMSAHHRQHNCNVVFSDSFFKPCDETREPLLSP